MRPRAIFLSCMVFAALALGGAAANRGAAAAAGVEPVEGVASASRAGRSIRVRCGRPPTLRLTRFEDGSARLECAGRVLVRVAVPG
ncbi:MAG: hypothetical protein FVQ78_02925 [Solirubrobacterales bacterium]|nr:hypothetical protein [Solirubrobacterales bacterium]